MEIKNTATSRSEKAILVALLLPGDTEWRIERSLEELARLAETAGADVVDSLWQAKDRPDAKLFIGRGKAQEIERLRQVNGADSVIFDDELSPSQQLNLEEVIGGKIVDRTGLILDIFAQHAHSAAGKLQVEMAQLNYYLPRLKGLGIQMSRLGGGIGTRGPGETQLETDRRRIHRRVQKLKKNLDDLKKHRSIQRRSRGKHRIFTASMVGYTNAGKSSLLKCLTGADVHIADQLFATLDSTTRKLKLPGGIETVLSDTVGFIEKLPHELVAAFHSTLDEMVGADLLLHVVDVSDPALEEHTRAVERVLEEIGAGEIPRVKVYNKADLVEDDALGRFRREADACVTSCVDDGGVDVLIAMIDDRASQSFVTLDLKLPYSEGRLRQWLYNSGSVLTEKHVADGSLIHAKVARPDLDRLKEFRL